MIDNSTWNQIAAAALLGIDRSGAQLPALPGPAGRLAGQPPEGDAAAHLLRLAAIAGLTRQAGWAPQPLEPVRAPALADELTICSAANGRLLRRILDRNDTLIPTWCCAAARRGQRVPDELLPRILEWNQKRGAPEVAAVLGRRGRWLASLNPAWHAAGAVDDFDRVWAHGSGPERSAALGRLRAATPAAAREKLIETWESETPEDRAAFVGQLKEGLSMEDEPFLESCLDDRRKEVRVPAAVLLADLPESQLCTRMSARVEEALVVTRKRSALGSRISIVLKLPERINKALTRDGIENRRRPEMGVLAWAMSQVLERTPLSVIDDMAESEPGTLIDAVRKSEWAVPVLYGIGGAAVRQRRVDWAQPLLKTLLAKPMDPLHDLIPELVATLPPADRETLVTTIPKKKSGVVDGPLLPILSGCRHDWSGELSRYVLERLRWLLGSKGFVHRSAERATIRGFAQYMSPGLFEEAATDWKRDGEHWYPSDEETVTWLATTLELRRAIEEGFADE